MIDKFSQEEMIIASYRLALENNALLEVMMGNQVAIMRKLDLPIAIKSDTWNQVIPQLPNQKPDKEFQKMRADAAHLAQLTQIRIWEFVTQLPIFKKDVADMEKMIAEG